MLFENNHQLHASAEPTVLLRASITYALHPHAPRSHLPVLFIAVWPPCYLALQHHRKLHTLAHMTVQVEPETAAGALSSSACSVWRPATACLSRISACLLPAAATASCLSQLWQREAHAGAYFAALHSLPPVCVSMHQIFRSSSCLQLVINPI